MSDRRRDVTEATGATGPYTETGVSVTYVLKFDDGRHQQNAEGVWFPAWQVVELADGELVHVSRLSGLRRKP